MNENNIYCGECQNLYVCFFGKKKKKKRRINKKMKITDGLSEATGIYQKCLRNLHTEFLANDGKFLSLIKVLHYLRVK